MIYGVILLINFAHGEIFMLGAFFALTFINFLHLPFYVAFVISMACCTIASLAEAAVIIVLSTPWSPVR